MYTFAVLLLATADPHRFPHIKKKNSWKGWRVVVIAAARFEENDWFCGASSACACYAAQGAGEYASLCQEVAGLFFSLVFFFILASFFLSSVFQRRRLRCSWRRRIRKFLSRSCRLSVFSSLFVSPLPGGANKKRSRTKIVGILAVILYRNVIPMRWDCGKNPVLSSVYLTVSHRIFRSQWPSSQIAMGLQRFKGQVPLQDHETFWKEHLVHVFWKIFVHEVFFSESFVILEGTWPLKRCGPIAICEEGHCDGKMRRDPVR